MDGIDIKPARETEAEMLKMLTVQLNAEKEKEGKQMKKLSVNRKQKN